jgi:hypothetical protein
MVVLDCAWEPLGLPEEGSGNDTITKPLLVILINEMTHKVLIWRYIIPHRWYLWDTSPTVIYVYCVVEDWCINAPFKRK